MRGKGSNLSKSFSLLDFFLHLFASFFATLNIGLFLGLQWMMLWIVCLRAYD